MNSSEFMIWGKNPSCFFDWLVNNSWKYILKRQ